MDIMSFRFFKRKKSRQSPTPDYDLEAWIGGNIETSVECGSKLLITYRDGEGNSREILERSSIGFGDERVSIWDIEVAANFRRVGWGRESMRELQRRFPGRMLVVVGMIEPKPDSVAFWHKMVSEGLVEAPGLADAEACLARNKEPEDSEMLQNYRDVQPLDEAKGILEQFQQERGEA